MSIFGWPLGNKLRLLLVEAGKLVALIYLIRLFNVIDLRSGSVHSIGVLVVVVIYLLYAALVTHFLVIDPVKPPSERDPVRSPLVSVAGVRLVHGSKTDEVKVRKLGVLILAGLWSLILWISFVLLAALAKALLLAPNFSAGSWQAFAVLTAISVFTAGLLAAFMADGERLRLQDERRAGRNKGA